MRSPCAVARALVLAGLWLASAAGPLALSDAGPHVHYGWGEAIRLRHLYTAGPHGPSSCFLRIRADGAVDCARGQSAHSLVEIRAVALRNVAIKGVHSVRYLCMGADGRMLGLVGVTTRRDELGRGTYACPRTGPTGKGGRAESNPEFPGFLRWGRHGAPEGVRQRPDEGN
ncbi:fibroblast growth factor 19-like [Pteropus vampyrus]|uniref:Fibroblast growth factor 19-like n=1 Tax=Pteropus vampyrus TaxID=132908 RepID=A0A6P3RIA6_PTEVA|nr:fibroblast growth factor 19-like [Pteropus vampyrus]